MFEADRQPSSRPHSMAASLYIGGTSRQLPWDTREPETFDEEVIQNNSIKVPAAASQPSQRQGPVVCAACSLKCTLCAVASRIPRRSSQPPVKKRDSSAGVFGQPPSCRAASRLRLPPLMYNEPARRIQEDAHAPRQSGFSHRPAAPSCGPVPPARTPGVRHHRRPRRGPPG